MRTRAPAEEYPPPPPYGWRDEPVTDDPCPLCEGWGTRRKFARIPRPERKDGYVLEDRGLTTCPRCGGTGHRHQV